MEKSFAEQIHDSVCMAFGEAVWQLIAIREPVTEEAIASMILVLSKRDPDVAEDIALSILRKN